MLFNFTTPYTYTGGTLLLTLRETQPAGGGPLQFDADSPDANGNALAAPGTNSTTGSTGNCPITELEFTTAAVPEPSTLGLMLAVCGLLGLTRPRRG